MTTIENDTSRTLQAVWASLLVCLAATIGCGEGSSAKPAASRVSAKTVDEIRHIAAMLLGVDPSKINAETSLADLGADELDLVELLIHLEDHFGVSIPDDLVNRAMGTDDFQQGIKNMTIAKFASIVDGQNQNHQRDSLQLPNDSGQVKEIKSQATSAPNVSLGDVTPGAKNVKVYINPLVILLAGAEKQKGEPLTREEVLEIRDEAVFVMMSEEQAEKFYRALDGRISIRRIDPDRIWEEWPEISEQLE